MESITRKDHASEIEYEILVKPEAAVEVQTAFDWYESQSQGLGFEFMRSADGALQSIRRNPHAYQTVYQQARRVLLRKFPYAFFYIIEENRIILLACFHQKRNEIDWLRRT